MGEQLRFFNIYSIPTIPEFNNLEHRVRTKQIQFPWEITVIDAETITVDQVLKIVYKKIVEKEALIKSYAQEKVHRVTPNEDKDSKSENPAEDLLKRSTIIESRIKPENISSDLTNLQLIANEKIPEKKQDKTIHLKKMTSLFFAAQRLEEKKWAVHPKNLNIRYMLFDTNKSAAASLKDFLATNGLHTYQNETASGKTAVSVNLSK